MKSTPTNSAFRNRQSAFGNPQSKKQVARIQSGIRFKAHGTRKKSLYCRVPCTLRLAPFIIPQSKIRNRQSAFANPQSKKQVASSQQLTGTQA
jgi:hypothetical protein